MPDVHRERDSWHWKAIRPRLYQRPAPQESGPQEGNRAGAPASPRQEVCQMRIIDIREITQPIASPIRNAYIDFSKMTTSLVAVVTDVVRDGRRVVGYGFNSNGRYGQ